jgi:hypothetical protein
MGKFGVLGIKLQVSLAYHASTGVLVIFGSIIDYK